MSQSTDTVKAYQARGEQLWLRSGKDCGVDPSTLQPILYLNWLENLLATIKPASRRQYIAASKELLINMYSKKHCDPNVEDNLEKAICKVHKMQSSQYSNITSIKKRWRARTSAQKAKKCGSDALKILAIQSKGMRGKWITPAVIWMMSNTLVGLRPCEWRTAKLTVIADKSYLIIRNGKHTNGRSHGEFRHLDVTDLKEVELILIQRQLKVVSQHAENDSTWKTYYSGVRKTIHKVTRKFMPYQRKYPTLYSTRHQFAANAKFAGMGKVEIAAMMGHATDETAGCNYGLKRYGGGGCKVKPDNVEMQKVRVKVINNQRIRKME